MTVARDLTVNEISPPFGQGWVVQLYQADPSEWLGTELVEKINATALSDAQKMKLARRLLRVRREIENDYEVYTGLLLKLIAFSLLVGLGIIFFTSAAWVTEGVWLSYSLHDFIFPSGVASGTNTNGNFVSYSFNFLLTEVDVLYYLFLVLPAFLGLLLKISHKAKDKKLQINTQREFRALDSIYSNESGYADIRGLFVMVGLIAFFSAALYLFAYSSVGPGYLLPPLERMFNQCRRMEGGSDGVTAETCASFHSSCSRAPFGKECRKYQKQLFDIDYPEVSAQYVLPEASPAPFTPMETPGPYSLIEPAGS